MDLTTLIIVCILVWIVAQIALGVIDGLHIVKLTQRLDVLKRLNNIIHQVKIEEHSGMEYWYDKDSNVFLGQGRTLDEVVEVLKARFPDHIFLLENRGGIAAKTGWQLKTAEEVKKIELISK